MSQPARVLVVAHRTAATPALLQTVRERAAAGGATFTLLVPNPAHGLHRVVDPEDVTSSEAEDTIELAIPLLEEAAGGHVEGLIGDEDPVRAVAAALAEAQYDEIVLSTLPARVSRWLHMDLPARLHRFGLPVTVVTAKKADRPLARTAPP
jgi:hypothetical protein